MNMAEDKNFNFEYMHTDSASEQLLQVMGGRADISMNTVGAAKSAYKDGTIKILAAVLGNMLESYYIQSTVALRHNMLNLLNRPICVGLLVLTVIFLLMPVRKIIKEKRSAAAKS